MRVGDALEKVCREEPGWFVAHVDRLCDGLGQIEQPVGSPEPRSSCSTGSSEQSTIAGHR